MIIKSRFNTLNLFRLSLRQYRNNIFIIIHIHVVKILYNIIDLCKIIMHNIFIISIQSNIFIILNCYFIINYIYRIVNFVRVLCIF